MFLIRKIQTGFDIKKQAKELGVPIWLTPTMLFLLIGIVTVFFMAIVYATAQDTENPYVLILSEIGVVIMVLSVGNFMVHLFEQLARTNKSKSEFIAIASHQMRSPLAQIKWFLELFDERYSAGMKPEYRDLLQRIGDTNEHLIRVTHDLLDVARIDQGETVVIKEKVDVIPLVRGVISSHDGTIEQKGIQINLKLKLHEERVWIVADVRRLRVAIDNIVSNAVKYTRRNGDIEIEMRDEDNFVVLCVKDNGIGIPERQQSRLFEKFFRAENAKKMDVSGTGLGLYLTKNIIEQLGGELWYRSIEDVGTLVCVRVPRYTNGQSEELMSHSHKL